VIPEDNTSDENVVQAIGNASSFLAGTSQDFNGRSKVILGKSLELRNLIHWIGDIHQPLHTVERYSEQTPDGDWGGNKFPIKHYPGKSKIWNNLHFIWDHIFDLPEQPTPSGGDLWSPLENEAEWEYLSQFALSLMEEHPFQSLSKQMKSHSTASSWAKVNSLLCPNLTQVGRTKSLQDVCLHSKVGRGDRR
jgi:hypothetical protein